LLRVISEDRRGEANLIGIAVQSIGQVRWRNFAGRPNLFRVFHGGPRRRFL
jgi:hypothetical protein